MIFYIVIAILACLILLSLVYVKADLQIELYEKDHTQGIILHIQLPFYKYHQSYDYSDPKLNLLEAVLADRINSRVRVKLGFNLASLKLIFRKLSQSYHISNYERANSHVLKLAANFTIVKDLQWRTTVGGSDAMYTALHTGYFWALKGWLVALVSCYSSLEHLELAVTPDFVKKIFLSNFTCILKMRIVHIIYIGIYILVWKVRWWINGITARATEQPSN